MRWTNRAICVRVQAHPQHRVLRADDAPQHLVRFADAAEDRELRPRRLHSLDVGRQVAGEAVAHSVDLVVARGEEAALVPRIVKLEGLHLLDRVGLEAHEGRHRIGQLLPQDRVKSRPDHDLFGVLRQDLEGPDVRIEVGVELHPIEVVEAVDVGVGGEPQFLAPAAQETAPEKVAHRDAVGLLVAQGQVHAFEFRQAVGSPGHSRLSPSRTLAAGPRRGPRRSARKPHYLIAAG